MAGTKAAPRKKKNLSSLKRVRQSEKKHERNQSVKTEIKTAIKKLDTVIATGDRDAIEKTFRSTEKTIHSAVSKGIVHRNTAGRRVSRIQKKVTKAFAVIPSDSQPKTQQEPPSA